MTPTERKMRLPQMVWTWPGATIVLMLLMLPIYGPMIPVVEGGLFPVTGKVEFIEVHPVEGGVSVRMKYTKLRDCEFIGVALDDNGFPVTFDPVAGGAPLTLPTGDRLSRPWLVGADTVDGLRLRWVHRCNPFWTTITVGYP